MKRGIKLIIYLLGIFTLISVSSINANASYNAKYYTQNIPSGYYDSVNLNLTEDSFRNNLYDIISAGYKQHSYKQNNTVLADTDPDPNSNGKIICFYTGRSLSSGAWNKEHVWAKSHGFPESGYSGSEPYSDAHHLRPTLVSINSTRGNKDFGEVSGGSTDGYGNYWNSSHFEPRDEVKGDVARIMFYMATRYGSKTKFNLKLVDQSTTSGSSLNGKFGNLQTLLKWHYQDPVSKEEIYRNNVIYENYQKNRNPYIDHPEYVDLAYPNSYSNQEIDQAKVNNVISLINNLPSVITLNDKTAVNNAKATYDALTSLEKNSVTNYNTLKNAIDTITNLENPSDPITPENPVTPENPGDIVAGKNSVTVVFSEAGLDNCGYTRNKSFTVDGNSYTASSLYVSGAKDVRLGHNKNTGSLAELGLSGDGEFLKPNYNLENLRSFSLSYTGSFGTISSWAVYFKGANSANYVEVASGSVGSSGTITATLASAQDGHFVLVITGTTPRIVISEMTYTVEEVQDPVTPENPGDTENPVTPENPGDTENPVTPETPGDTQEPQAPAEPEKGCGGSIVGSLVATVTLFGVVLVCKKRKDE